MIKVINNIKSIKVFTNYEMYENNRYVEVLPALISFSEKSILNGSSEALMQLYDTQLLYDLLDKPIIQIQIKYNDTIEQFNYGLEYSNVVTDEMNRSILRLNLAPVHSVYRRMFSKSFSNNATQVITECVDALYEYMPLIKPKLSSTNIRIPPACLSGTYDYIFNYIRDNGQSVEMSDWCYVWEDGSSIYMQNHYSMINQTPLIGYKYNVNNPFVGDTILFTKAEYIMRTDNKTDYQNTSFYSFSLDDKTLYYDSLANVDSENRWVMSNRTFNYQDNYQNPTPSGLPYTVDKIKTLASFEQRIKFDINQGRLDLRVGSILEIRGSEYNGVYLVVECVRDMSKDAHIQTIECVRIKDLINLSSGS
ncbi:baseplate hub subunit [Morganella phage vB_Mm5]